MIQNLLIDSARRHLMQIQVSLCLELVLTLYSSTAGMFKLPIVSP